MTVFLGVYKAIYPYEPQTEEELAIEEDDLLYLLEKSQVDDWWTVQKRVIGNGEEVEEPSGLVPNNYIEEAPVLYQATSLYEYKDVQNTNEELSFKEGEVFDIYDDRDTDWLLARAVKDGSVGFVPGNYVEANNKDGVEAKTEGKTNSVPFSGSVTDEAGNKSASSTVTTAKKTVRSTKEEYPSLREEDNSHSYVERPLPNLPGANSTNYDSDSSNEEEPPPMPKRPQEQRASVYLQSHETAVWVSPTASPKQLPNLDGRSWDVSEVEGRKKKKARLSIHEGIVYFDPSDTPSTSWKIQDLLTYNNEKKHVFLEFRNPYANLELHTGSTDVAEEIKSIFAEYMGAKTDKAIREVEAAANANAKRTGVVKSDFIGDGPDDLTVKEGNIVYVSNAWTSKDSWWMCELAGSGKQGYVPAKLIQLESDRDTKELKELKQENRKSLSSMVSTLKSMGKGSTGKSTDVPPAGDWKHDADQDVIGRKKSVSRKKDDKRSTKKKKFPDPNNSRIWVDRSNTFKVEAEFLALIDGKIHLHKANGVKIAVAAEKLSLDDLLYVEKVKGVSLDQYKPKASKKSSGAQEMLADSKSQSDHQRMLLNLQNDREREREERERDRRIRERELNELKKTRDLLEQERQNIKSSREKELASGSRQNRSSSINNQYDWFEFFLKCGIDVKQCQLYEATFQRERIAEEILPELSMALLRALEIREGDVIRITKFLDQKYNRTSSGLPSSNVVSNNNDLQHGLPEQLLPSRGSSKEDDAWTTNPAAKAEAVLPQTKKEFSGSLQDLLDLKPLEPTKKEETPQPKLQALESVKTSGSNKTLPEQTNSIAPLDPFRTGGHNLLPNTTGGVFLLPVMTGGILPVQSNTGILPIQSTGGLVPLQNTGGMIPLQRTGGFVSMQRTGGMTPMPQTTFGMNPAPTGALAPSTTGGPVIGTILPVQKTGQGLIPAPFGITATINPSTGATQMMPQTTFGAQPLVGQNSFGSQPIAPNLTGGLMPLQRTGTAMGMPQTSFGTQPSIAPVLTGNAMLSLQRTGGTTMPQTSFSTFQPQPMMSQSLTGGVNIMPLQRTGGAFIQGQVPLPSQTMFPNVVPMQQSMTGGIMNMHRTGGLVPLPQTTFGNGTNTDMGVNQLTNNMQYMNMNPQQQPLQNQPTGFGFGNAPQPNQRQANIYNASAANPFGF